ncbi:hypothetical protein K488DRAFT_51609 [Vararia minispora EC-137]|uniref:Uncharacterized protein n=1 Tax=Vararia minispora EC-137 TaxID=1314806 RepID=A0ACB8QJE3_9AGAM|nr:hypothetical protein K488DRAFT_51609 [Vararia minispora EC-137]
MPVNTVTAAIHITPVVIKTFFNHYGKKSSRTVQYVTAQEVEYKEHARDELIFDEAFHIVKAFIELSTKNSIESLQAFTNTHIPSPYWVAVAPVLIPFTTCNGAADLLIDWFGPDELARVVGGERWWQVRGLDGLEGEWVTEKAFLGESAEKQKANKQDNDSLIAQMDDLEPVMLYVHGGGYFFGSINTHRYQIIRYAKKLKGRAFAVNYRKAPQYPWPCPLHDVLAAYFYLTDPPPGSPHKPVSPSKIVIAGDSAGGSLCLSALIVLRDMGVPMPAGAVLISPWVDLTHSMPSVMTNTKTDIIPLHGFVYRPSTLWPVAPLADEAHPRVRETQTNPPPQPGHADILNPDPLRLPEQQESKKTATKQGVSISEVQTHRSHAERVARQKEMQAGAHQDESARSSEPMPNRRVRDVDVNAPADGDDGADVEDLDKWEPKPPKVLMEDPGSIPLELLSQIQQYATNEQLTHPLVSPILQGTLCNLPPLYIITGNDEALRDEVIRLAYRAAYPDKYPVRGGVLKESRRQQENVEKFTTPTKVHLQVFDDMPHVPTVFTFIESAKYAYRSIAQFILHVTSHSPEYVARNPFPEPHRPEFLAHTVQKPLRNQDDAVRGEGCCGCFPSRRRRVWPADAGNQTCVDHYTENERIAAREVEEEGTESPSGMVNRAVQIQTEDIPRILMIRERVDIRGRIRPMEPPKDIAALRMKPNEVGIIKETPVRRWHAGQEAVDREFEKSAHSILKRRQKIEERVEKMLRDAREEGLILPDRRKTFRATSAESRMSARTIPSSVRIDQSRRYGPLDLAGEHPPASAIAGRRDTLEALALIKKHIYHTAPATHLTVPKIKVKRTILAAFDPWNRASTKPSQSVSERQVTPGINALHGLSIWGSLVSYFMRKTSSAAVDAVDGAVARIDDLADAVVNSRTDRGGVATRSHDQERLY